MDLPTHPFLRRSLPGLVMTGLGVLLSLAACSMGPPPKLSGGDPSNPLRTVAVLPFINNTNDVNGPLKVQQEFAVIVYEKYYDIMEVGQINQALKDQMGVTLGSQLDMADPGKVCAVLKTDGIMYGSLDDYGEKLTGVYNVRRVRVRAKLVNCKTGLMVWKGGAGAKSQFVHGGQGLEQVPVAGLIVAGIGVASAVGSAMSDANEEPLKPVFGEDIQAPWSLVPEPPKAHVQSSGNLIADLAIHVVGAVALTVAEQAADAKLIRERVFATERALATLPRGPSDED